MKKALDAKAGGQKKADKGTMDVIIVFTLVMIVFMLDVLSMLIHYFTLMTVWEKNMERVY